MPTIAVSGGIIRQMGTPVKGLQFAVEHGFYGMEIGARYLTPEQLPPEESRRFRSIAALNGVDLSVHAPLDWNPATFSPELRPRLLGEIRALLQRSAEIGAQVLVLHAAAVDGPGIVRGQVPESVRASAIERLTSFLQESAPTAQALGVVIGLENLPYLPGVQDARGIERSYDVLKTYEELVQVVRDAASPAVRITLDIGHADRAEGIWEAFQAFAPYLRHIHIHDSDGRQDHQEIGLAKVDFKGLSDLLAPFPHMMVMEIIVQDDPAGAAIRSRDRLKAILGNAAR
ncbi:MAG: sugar phosphate isomerase/epimerase [Chloroflexi bacterium]|nr:sugar phosphate isomerase/epimerase [Chloroflexota bacterium]